MFQAGADYLAGENVLLGAMVVGDAANERSTDLGYQVDEDRGHAEAAGWQVYTVGVGSLS